MNRWKILEHIEALYMRTGRVPTRTYLQYEFSEADPEELQAAINEFNQKVQRFEEVICSL